jgi:hypothetical protein
MQSRRVKGANLYVQVSLLPASGISVAIGSLSASVPVMTILCTIHQHQHCIRCENLRARVTTRGRRLTWIWVDPVPTGGRDADRIAYIICDVAAICTESQIPRHDLSPSQLICVCDRDTCVAALNSVHAASLSRGYTECS